MRAIHRTPPPWARSFDGAGGHSEDLLAHPDGRRLIALDLDGTVTVWDVADSRRLHHLPATLSAGLLEDARGAHLKLHPDGIRLFATVVITDTSDVCHCWNLDTGELIDRLDYPRVPGAFLGEHQAVTAHGLYLTLWDLETGETIRQRLRDDASWGLLGMVGPHALVAGRGTFEVWHVPDGRRCWATDEVRGAAIAGDVFTLVRPGQLTFHDVHGTEVRRVLVPDLVGEGRWSVHVDPAATTAVVAAGELLAIDLATGAVRSRFPRPRYVDISIAPCGDAIVWDPVEHVSTVWSLATGATRLRLPAELVLSPDGETAYSCDGANVRAWNVDGGDHTAQKAAWIALAVATVPDAIVGLDRECRVHVVDPGGAPRHAWGPLPHGARLAGARVAYVEGTAVVVVDAITGERLHELAIGARSLAMSVDWLVTVHQNGEIQLRPSAEPSAEPVARFRARGDRPDVLAIAPTRVAVAVDTTLELWRANPPLRLHTFRSRTRPWCAAIDPSRRWLVSGHEDGALLVRDAIARTHHATLELGKGVVVAAAIRDTHRGCEVAACVDGRVTVWDLVAGVKLGDWGDDRVVGVTWVEDDTLACATERGLVLLRV